MSIPALGRHDVSWGEMYLSLVTNQRSAVTDGLVKNLSLVSLRGYVMNTFCFGLFKIQTDESLKIIYGLF